MSEFDGTLHTGPIGPATLIEQLRAEEERAVWVDAGGGQSLREVGERLNPQPPGPPVPPGMIDG
jgi:hypothetical protein